MFPPLSTIFSPRFPTDNGSSGTSKFRVDPASGVVATIGAFDRDGAAGRSYYDIALVATDGGSPARTATRTLRVGIVNVNDNTPAFGQSVYDASVAEDQTSGTSVSQLAATDGDVTSSLTYMISDGNAAAKFAFRFGRLISFFLFHNIKMCIET